MQWLHTGRSPPIGVSIFLKSRLSPAAVFQRCAPSAFQGFRPQGATGLSCAGRNQIGPMLLMVVPKARHLMLSPIEPRDGMTEALS